MAKYNLKGPVDAIQFIEDTTVHPSVGTVKAEYHHSMTVLYEVGNSGDYDIIIEGDWIVTDVNGKNFAVDEALFERLFEPVA